MVVSVTVATTMEVAFVKRILREEVVGVAVVTAEAAAVEAVEDEEENEKRKGRKSHPSIWTHKWRLTWQHEPNLTECITNVVRWKAS